MLGKKPHSFSKHPSGFFCAKNHTRLLHWPQQNKNFMLYSRKNRLKSVPGKLTVCNVPCQWEERSLAQRRCCQKGVWIFLPESWHHAFYLFLVSFAMLKGKKESIFFCVLLESHGASSSTNWFLPLPCYFRLPEGACLVTGQRLQAVLSRHMNGRLLSLHLGNIFASKLLRLTKQPLQRPAPLPFCAAKATFQLK